MWVWSLKKLEIIIGVRSAQPLFSISHDNFEKHLFQMQIIQTHVETSNAHMPILFFLCCWCPILNPFFFDSQPPIYILFFKHIYIYPHPTPPICHQSCVTCKEFSFLTFNFNYFNKHKLIYLNLYKYIRFLFFSLYMILNCGLYL